MKPLASPRVGAVRPSQLMFSHGVGALIDLPNFSAVVLGLDEWDATHQQTLVERRLLAAVRQLPGMEHVEALRTAPWLEETRNPFDDWARVGVPVVPFPRWMRCTGCNLLIPIDSGLLDLKHEPYRPDRTRFVHNCRSDGKPPLAVPARFVTACPDGHLDEFPWIEFCHYKQPCSGKPQVRLNEIGGSRSTDVQIECVSCGQKMHLSQAFGEPGRRTMPQCRGRHPHLRRFAAAGCTHQLRAVLLGASNAWFPVTRSALSLPVAYDPLDQLIEKHWPDLTNVVSREELDAAVKFAPALKVFANRDLNRVWEHVEQRRRGAAVDEAAVDLLGPEWLLLQDPAHAPLSDDFRVRESPVPDRFRPFIERAVLVERLRVVTALCGFTRIDGPDSGVAEDQPEVQCAPLARDLPKWVPAAEARGEGVFLQLSEDAVARWEERVAGSRRLELLRRSHQRWRERRGLDPAAKWEGPRYVLLHSLAHALATELALECGYSPASVQERIYAREPGGSRPAMAGLLIYTAASDSEGTLGGLVALGETDSLDRLLTQALERSRLCSADPLCAEHVPDASEDALHNASCHACLFVPETTCERGNRYLDRAVLVRTLSADSIEYFTS
ncbi:MAG: DUF1998 domain-containing protein [Acidobacteriota bacterium]